jgi:integrase
LRQHRRRQAAERLAAGPDWRNIDSVFCTRQGGYVEQQVVRGRMAAVEKGSGMPAIRFHDLHHTHATLLLRQARRSVKEVSERLGPANVTVTLQLYAHVLADQHVEMAHVIGGVLDGGL